MATAPARLLMVLSAYTPLMLILAARSWDDRRGMAVALIVLAAVSLIVLRLYLRLLSRAVPEELEVVSADTATSEILGYITAYLFPFLEVDFASVPSLLSLAGVYAVILFVQVKANLVHVNPALYAFGYHVLNVTVSLGRRYALISRRDYIPAGSTVRVVRAGNYVLLEKR